MVLVYDSARFVIFSDGAKVKVEHLVNMMQMLRNC